MVKLSYTQYSRYFTCKIENILDLNVDILKKLEQFASERSGSLDYDKEIIRIPKRIELQHLQELFSLKHISVFISEEAPRKYKISDLATINYGKFKGTKWTDLEDGYLQWLSSNINSDDRDIARNEIKRRTAERAKPTKQTAKNAKELKMIIGFGKFRGQTWGELPKDYLSWVASNLQGEAQRIAQVVLAVKS